VNTSQQNPAPIPPPPAFSSLPTSTRELKREDVVRWLIEELPNHNCIDSGKSRMKMDETAVTSIFGKDLDMMFANGSPEAIRFGRVWSSMSTKLANVAGQEGLPPMTITTMTDWLEANPVLVPPPDPPPPDHVDLGALMGGQDPNPSLNPPDPSIPPPPVAPTVNMPIPPAPPIPGDGQISTPPAGYPAGGSSQVAPTVVDPPNTKPTTEKKKTYQMVAVFFAIGVLLALIGAGIYSQRTAIARTYAAWTTPKPTAKPAPTQAPPVQTANPTPVAPTGPAQKIVAKCDYDVGGEFGFSNCSWVKGPGQNLECDIDGVGGKVAAKCGDWSYHGGDMPDGPARGVILEMTR
jgi:hypothetical protein